MDPIKIHAADPNSVPLALYEEANKGAFAIQLVSLSETTGQGLSFRDGALAFSTKDLGDLVMDWDENIKHYERNAHRGRQEIISKAIGLHKNRNLRVLDATMGLGQDSIFLATLGAKIIGVERHPELFLLLVDAKRRLQNSAYQNQIEIKFGEARDWMVHLQGEYDVLYLDPMFKETKKKTALPRKEMQIFRSILQELDDGPELLKAALRINTRIVLKRPLRAPEMMPGRAHSFEGSTVRYDIYRGGLL